MYKITKSVLTSVPFFYAAFELVGWPKDQIAPDIATALKDRTTTIVANADELFDADIDVIVEATGNPIVGVDHALRAIATGKHIIMVTVEADALAGPALAKRARSRRRGLLHGLRRPAGADHGAGRLGPHQRLRRGLRGQGRQVPRALPRDEPGQRLGELGVLQGAHRLGPAEPLHAHLVP